MDLLKDNGPTDRKHQTRVAHFYLLLSLMGISGGVDGRWFAYRTPVALRIRCGLTTEGQARYNGQSSKGISPHERHVRDCVCLQLVDVHLANESTRPPFKSVDRRAALLSTNPLHNCCDLHFTINHQHRLQQSYNNQHHELLPHQ